jgi:hypothetical protein
METRDSKVGIVEAMCASVRGSFRFETYGKQALPQSHGWRPFERDRFPVGAFW